MRYRKFCLCKVVAVFVMVSIFVFTPGYSVMAKGLPSFHEGIRPLGMGGAFTAVADDENALFYNPAGLSRIPMLQLGIINPLGAVSGRSIDLMRDAMDIDMNNVGQVSDLLEEYMGEHQHLRGSVFPHVGFSVVGVGVMVGGLMQGTFDAMIRSPAWPAMHVDFITDKALLAGAGLELPLTGLSAGIAIKYVYRRSLSEVYTAVDIAAPAFEDRLDDDLKSGSGVSADIGVMYELALIPLVDTRVALVAQNIPQMDMGDAKDIKSQLNAGISFTKSFAGFRALFALDYRDITKNIGDSNDIPKRIHMGAELQLPMILAVRAGLNQGYLTAGATIDLWALRFDLATYAEEVGVYAGQREDRRYMAQISLGW
ncbi:hypothetical protein M1M99_01810 [Thermodesulfovibrionales bacterium]|nr:hypothetical protein [Thermodesulfovibrionales bacterium]